MSFTKDAFRPDAGLRNDDWRLECNLQKHLSEHSNFSYRSASPDTVLEKGCKHRSLLYQARYDTCRHCGVYVSKNGVKSYKSERMNFLAFFPSKTIYETLIKRSHSFKQSQNEEYIQLRLAYVDWIFELSGKFGISNQSSHLAVFLLDFIMFKDPSLTQKIPLYAPTCLLLATKTIELDQRIPFISKLKRYANSIHSIEEFKKAELHVLDLMDWNALFTSSFELLEFLLCQGVIFSNDEVEESTSPLLPQKGSPIGLSENTQHENTNHLEGRIDTKRYLSSNLYAKENNENSLSEGSTATHSENAGTLYLLTSGRGVSEEGVFQSPPKEITILQKHNSTPATSGGRLSVSKPSRLNEKKITKILDNIESAYTKLASMVLKDFDFLQFEPKIISAGMLAFLRYTNKLVQIWNAELEVITGLQFSQVSPCFEIIYKKYASSFQIASPKPQNILNAIDSNQNRTPELRQSIGEKNVSSNSHKKSYLTDGYRKTIYAEPIIKSDYNSSRLSEKKTIFGSQGKSYIPTSHQIPYKLPAESSSYLSEYSYRSRPSIGESFGDNSYPNISRNPILQSNYQPSKLTSKNDYSSNYSGTTRTRVSENKYQPSSGFSDLLSENRFPSSYTRLTARSTSTIESGIRGKYH